MKYLALIPARAGSSLKGKNTRYVYGKPLIQWTINHAKNSGCFDKIVVSTNDPFVAQLASDSKVDSVWRPSELCGEKVTLIEVILHTLKLYSMTNIDAIVTLPPTSPMRNDYQIKDAISLFEFGKYDSLISVVEERKSLFSQDFSPIIIRSRGRQDEEPFYIFNGAISITSKKVLSERGSRIGSKLGFYKMDSWSSLDIHTDMDLHIADFLLRRKTLVGDV